MIIWNNKIMIAMTWNDKINSFFIYRLLYDKKDYVLQTTHFNISISLLF